MSGWVSNGVRADVSCKVDVEVVRHAYAREGSHTLMGGPLQTARSYMHRSHRSSEGPPKSAEQAGDGIPAGTELQKGTPTTGVPTEEAATVTQAEGEQDDEGWASEDSGYGTISTSSAVRVPGARRKRVRLSRGKPAGAGLNKKGRRRSSASEHGRSSSHARSPSSDTTPAVSLANEPERAPDAREDTDPRGRSTHHERKSSGLSSHPSIQHRRLESLRLSQHSRDASPSRSIRFADEHPSGTSTPRNGMLQNESWLPNNQMDDPSLDEDAESARGRVTFELPAKH